ncbi:MAG: hypothetical protein DMF95_06660 [Acidobacteria bacterium]|nr:MAG: hypothetical protein DMF95_06660 [Acidobacteriota bacterium]
MINSIERTSIAVLFLSAVLGASGTGVQQPAAGPTPPQAGDPAADRGGRPSPTTADQPSPNDAKKKTRKKKKQKERETTGAEDVGTKSRKHPAVHVGDALTLDVTGRIETDARLATRAIGLDQPQLEWQDRRIGIKGTAYRKVTFELARELGKDFEESTGLSEKTAWRDAYVNVRVTKAFNVEAGHFKLPFGYEELTGETNLDFAYRSLAARVLSPGRDPGIMTHGRLFGRRVEYQAGYFTRDGSNARTNLTEGGHDAFAARVVVMPFAADQPRAIDSLQVGIAAADSRLENQLGIRGRTALGDGVFFDRLYVNGRRRRIGLEAAWANGPVSLSSEYITFSDERKGMGFSAEDLPGIGAQAWYVAGTWSLTGERKHGRLEPRHDVGRGGIGAFELAARVEALRFSSVSYPGLPFGFPSGVKLGTNADHVTTIGVNWYVNRYVKLQNNIIFESVEDAGRSPAPSAGGRFTSAVFRIQFRL